MGCVAVMAAEENSVPNHRRISISQISEYLREPSQWEEGSWRLSDFVRSFVPLPPLPLYLQTHCRLHETTLTLP